MLNHSFLNKTQDFWNIDISIFLPNFAAEKINFRIMKKYVLILTTCLLSACDGVFDIHPYDVKFNGETGINKKQMAVIESQFKNSDTLRVAFIRDTHLWLSDARDQVADVNKRNVDFVVHCGDLTDTATAKEYEWSRDILQGLKAPFVALIGNHDYLGTCDLYIRSMFQTSIPLKDILGLSFGAKFYMQ